MSSKTPIVMEYIKMSKTNGLLIILVVLFGLSLGYHIYRRHSTDFLYIDKKIETDYPCSLNAERYELIQDGFRVEKGNFFFYTDEVFKHGHYTYKLRVLGFPVVYRSVNYPRNRCWGFPGVPGSSLHEGWFIKGEKRFQECLTQVELYKEHFPKEMSQ